MALPIHVPDPDPLDDLSPEARVVLGRLLSAPKWSRENMLAQALLSDDQLTSAHLELLHLLP